MAQVLAHFSKKCNSRNFLVSFHQKFQKAVCDTLYNVARFMASISVQLYSSYRQAEKEKTQFFPPIIR
jgi:hypothetical protein